MSTSPNGPMHLLELHNSGRQIPAIRLTKDNPKAAALISKLVVDQRAPAKTQAMNEQGTGLNIAAMRQMAHEGIQNVNDHETIRQLLSDTDLAASILVSVILSPKDMVGVEVNYVSEPIHWQLPHEVKSTLTNTMRRYFDETYKIKPRLPEMLEDILFKRGCYPVAVLPENAVDDLIHGNGGVSLESIKTLLTQDGQIQSLGLLGPTDKEAEQIARQMGYGQGIGLALEHLITHQPNKDWDNEVKFYDQNNTNAEPLRPGINVTDNLGILKMPLVAEKIRKNKIQKLVGRTSALSNESIAKRVVNPTEPFAKKQYEGKMVHAAFHRPNTSHVIVKEVKPQDQLKRRSVGMPLEIHFPSESVIPVHVPNQPSKQIGFFVLLDIDGHPINRGIGTNHYRELGLSLQNNSFSSAMIQRAGLALNDNSAMTNQGLGYATAAQLYAQMLQRNLVQRLKNGLGGKQVEISGQEEVYNLMFARSMANQHTQLLYIPVEYMTYMALDYNTNGTGRSLLENTKIIDSMQANLLVGTIMGALRNAIGRTHVDIQLDEDTPDPQKAIETAMGEMMRVNSNGFPLGTIDPLDIKDGLQRSAYEFSFSGSSRLPDMKIDFSEKNSNYQAPDSKIMEDLRKRRLMSFWLTPEMVDAATGADFAASVVNNSTLLSKRAMMLQQRFTPQVSEHLKKHAINSADLVDELVETIQGSFEDILKEFKDDEEIVMFDGTVTTKNEIKTNGLVKVQFIRELIEDFIGGFSLTLPEPDTTKLNNLSDLYEKQSNLVESAIKAWISDDMMDDSIVGTEMASHVRIAAAQMKAYLLRDWQIKNGLLPELAALTARGDDGEVEVDLAEIQAAHNEAIIGVMTTLITANKKAKEKAAKDLEKAGITAGSGGGFGSDSSSSFGGDSGSFGSDSNTSGGSSGGDGGFSLGNDFNFDMGGTGSETSSTDDNKDTSVETPEEISFDMPEEPSSQTNDDTGNGSDSNAESSTDTNADASNNSNSDQNEGEESSTQNSTDTTDTTTSDTSNDSKEEDNNTSEDKKEDDKDDKDDKDDSVSAT